MEVYELQGDRPVISKFRLAGTFDDMDTATLAVTIQMSRHMIKHRMKKEGVYESTDEQ